MWLNEPFKGDSGLSMRVPIGVRARLARLVAVVCLALAARQAIGTTVYFYWPITRSGHSGGVVLRGDADWQDAPVAWMKEAKLDPYDKAGQVTVTPFESYGPYMLYLVRVEE